MPVYRIEATGESREIYEVVANDAREARAMYDRGDLDKPVVSEVTGADIESIELMVDPERGAWDCSGQRAGAGYNTDPRE